MLLELPFFANMHTPHIADRRISYSSRYTAGGMWCNPTQPNLHERPNQWRSGWPATCCCHSVPDTVLLAVLADDVLLSGGPLSGAARWRGVLGWCLLVGWDNINSRMPSNQFT